MLKNILPLSFVGFKNSQRQKTVILSVLRRISACPWANVNGKDEYGYTALIRASMFSHVEVVRFLLDHDGVDVNTKDDFGVAALIAGSRKGHLEVVRALLKHDGVDVNIKNDHGATALIIAIEKGHVEVVRALLNHVRVDVNTKNNNGDAALHLASLSGRVELVHALMNHRRVEVNVKNNHGATALTLASEMGHVEVVRALLNHVRVDVNIKNSNHGDTALILASWKGHLEVARALLKHHGVDVNIQNNNGNTALTLASYDGHVEVVRALLEHDGVDVNIKNNHGATALDCARRQKKADVALLLELHIKRDRRQKTGWTWMALVCASVWGSLSAVSSFRIEQFRKKLDHVMNTISAEPVELSLAYIERCIKKDHKLGSGAFGDVFLAEDSRLPKKFAVKMISPTKCDDATIKEIRKTFRTELSTLKKCRHPNIIVLYGYSLNANRAQQCLVYEYAANGSLVGFFADVGNRARLSSDTRLSIMFQLVRAVHFLHTGGCKKVTGDGWKVFHRDIKSANICVADDLTPRLIDCGQAEYVPDESSSDTPGSFSVFVRNKTAGPVFGTAGYICPEFARMQLEGISCPYIPAFDVFSIGVVMVEIILGCLINRNGTQFDSAFRRYVNAERDQLVVDGWEKLKGDADPVVKWNPEALELVCKTAIWCMAPFPEDRLSTDDLLGELNRANQLHFGIRNSEPPKGAASHGNPCVVCNRNGASMKCSEGHALCSSCIEESLLSAPLPGIGGCQLTCLIDMCSSHPLQDKDLYRHINVGIFIKYIMGRELYGSASPLSNMNELLQNTNHVVDQMHAGQQDTRQDVEEVIAGQQGIRKGVDKVHAGQQGIKKGVDDVKAGQHGIKEGVDEVNAGQKGIKKVVDDVHAGQKKLATGLNWALGALSLLTANEFKECPNLVVMTPSSIKEKNWSNPINWVKWVGKQRFKVVFCCAHSHQPGHEPFEISVTRKWIVKAAPWLKRCLQLLAFIANVQCLPFPIPNLSFLDQCKNMKEFYDSLREERSLSPMKTLEGAAFNAIAEKAKENRSHWDGPMVSVTDDNGAPIWVKEDFKEFYQVSSSGLVEI
ncbi:serine/threonine kinase [Fragilaria crotonensis]|nr:serine/threonine kinase [Fragilaria crotonensis]